ncbi:BspA family leucine-rich repeat surface protein, partial [Flavobacterium sp.]|uniref:BspA family leucine-rich repeat surface protein n=1 Tax=Flavobacterium sp. TaxID=239 RepID=UPI0037BF4AAA
MKNIYTLLLIGLLSFSSLINAQLNPNFTVHTNGVTCLCPNAANLETGDVNGVTYTKRTREQITESNASTTCTSGITDMNFMFHNTGFNGNINSWDTSSVINMNFMFAFSDFNQNISDWNVSNVTNMGGMFQSTIFNQPIGNWNVSNVTDMVHIFYGNNAFNQDISNWIFNTNIVFNNSVSYSNFLSSSNYNISYYNALLQSFSNQNLTNKNFRVQGLLYSNQTARNNLINNKGWTINGDTYSPPPAPPILSTSYVAPRKVKIDFTPSISNNVTEYKVYKSTNNTTFTLA